MQILKFIFYMFTLIVITRQYSSTFPTLEENNYFDQKPYDILRSIFNNIYSKISIEISNLKTNLTQLIYNEYINSRQNISESTQSYINNLLKIDSDLNEKINNETLTQKIEKTFKNDIGKYIKSI